MKTHQTSNTNNTSFTRELIILQDEIDQLSEKLAHLESLVELHIQSIQAFNNIH